jgi:hypothetical protein
LIRDDWQDEQGPEEAEMSKKNKWGSAEKSIGTDRKKVSENTESVLLLFWWIRWIESAQLALPRSYFSQKFSHRNFNLWSADGSAVKKEFLEIQQKRQMIDSMKFCWGSQRATF